MWKTERVNIMAKHYFTIDSECAYTLKYWKGYMKKNGITELKLFEAIVEYSSGYFWCNEYSEAGEVGESCGKQCEKYSPRNGKNGRCRHSVHVYSFGESKIIKI